MPVQPGRELNRARYTLQLNLLHFVQPQQFFSGEVKDLLGGKYKHGCIESRLHQHSTFTCGVMGCHLSTMIVSKLHTTQQKTVTHWRLSKMFFQGKNLKLWEIKSRPKWRARTKILKKKQYERFTEIYLIELYYGLKRVKKTLEFTE